MGSRDAQLLHPSDGLVSVYKNIDMGIGGQNRCIMQNGDLEREADPKSPETEDLTTDTSRKQPGQIDLSVP